MNANTRLEADRAIHRDGVVRASLNFIGPADGKPETYNYTPPPGVPVRNFGDDPHEVAIRDLRADPAAASLDREGFAVLRHRSAERDFADEAAIVGAYYAETEALLRQATGAHRVFIFDHTIRRRIPGQEDRAGQRQPVARVHVDQTLSSGPERVRRHLGAEAAALLDGRVQVINVWRPIRGPVLDSPLAVCDGSSLAPGDLVATDLVYPQHRGEVYSVRHNPGQRWHYLSRMMPDEVLLLKCYDSRETGVSRFAPHTAFSDPTTPPDAPPRQSIELRALVFGAT
ncbi:CmcJ/NvfI family oxidoreductase [Lichenicoccus roseus]|uniref:Methyltransferase n=1 Tax=Lichenicoccus roseus TaxID=2683649 RepID=A0A5R9J864_9PROT|nr:CmcJ/NvfI family oxidoreductase [Lichenicoccus roseus]TLU73785.1 methyltransferase [Lichenicoccus roseus]